MSDREEDALDIAVSPRRSRSPSPGKSPRDERLRSRSRSPRRSRSRSGGRHRRRSRSGERRRPRDGHGSRSASPMSSRKRHVGDRDNPDKNRCIGVFGLSFDTSERKLKEVFEKYGAIDDLQLVKDNHTGRSRGFAFIYYKHTDDAAEAKEDAAGTELDGRKIRVDFSITERAHTPTPGVYLGRPTQSTRPVRGRGGGGGRRDDYNGGGGRRRSPSPYYRDDRRGRRDDDYRRDDYRRDDYRRDDYRRRSRSYSPRRY